MTKGLGRGLSALFSDTEESYENAQQSGDVSGNVNTISLDCIFPNPNQPRKIFDESALKELATSIKEHGVIMPIVVNRQIDGNYMIIAGERRYRASKLAGLKEIPAIVKEYSDREVEEVSLIENLQREDLNPVEAAAAMKRLLEEYNITQDELAVKIGKSRPAIANTLRLLTLESSVIEFLKSGKLSAGHARALVTLPKEMQEEIALKAIKEGYSVRETEKLVKSYLVPPEILQQKKEQKTAATSLELKDMISRMREDFKTKVSLIGNDKKGRIYIDYYTKDDLDRICEILDIIERQS